MNRARQPAKRPQPMPAVADTPPYRVPRPTAPIRLRLDSNEGAPPSAALLEQLHANLPRLASRYPSKIELEAHLARHLDVPAEQVIVTAGGDDALDRACRAVLGPGRSFVVPWPSFEMLPRYAALTGADLITVPWLEGEFPAEAVCEAVTPKTAAIAVVSPNNPTGAVATAADLRILSAAAPQALLLVDLAYAEFADKDLTAVALELPNAIVVRTFSKAWGLAGLRVGYAVGPGEYITWLRAAGSPYPTSSLSVALADKQLELCHAEMQAFVSGVRRERAELVELLAGWGAKVWPTQANFVLAAFGDAEAVWNGLGERGIAVRRFANRPDLADTLRITCPGNAASFAELVQSLTELHEQRPAAFAYSNAGAQA